MKLAAKGKAGTKPRSVSLNVMFWFERGAIHMATNDPDAQDFHVAIRDDPTKRSGHPMLYRRLRAYLEKMGAPSN